MFGGSRPKRALTIRATWPAGTIGTVGTACAAGACAAGAGGGGHGGGCAAGGRNLRRFGSAPAGCCGSAGPDGAIAAGPPGGTKLCVVVPTDPGGRGIASNPGGTVVCAAACDAPNASTSTAAAQSGRSRPAGADRRPVM